MKFVFPFLRKLMQDIIEFVSICIIDRNPNHFLDPYEEKTSYTFLGGCLSTFIPISCVSNRISLLVYAKIKTA
jgi:hypothetical protein